VVRRAKRHQQRNRLRQVFSRSHDAVIRVYDEAGKRDRNARARGQVQRVVSFARVTSHSPLKRSSMIPLLSGQVDVSKRIRPKKCIFESAIIGPNPRYMVEEKMRPPLRAPMP
jgi:hypothetical protein